MLSLKRTRGRALSILLMGLLTGLGTTSMSCRKKAHPTNTLTLEGRLEERDRRIQGLEREVEGLKQIDTRPESSRPPR